MWCPPSLEPIPIVVHIGDSRIQHESTETRKLWIYDTTEDGALHWWSGGFVEFENASQERRRIRYRRRVAVPYPETVEVEGWTHHCWKGGILAMTCEVVLEPGEVRRVDLDAISTHSTRFIHSP